MQAMPNTAGSCKRGEIKVNTSRFGRLSVQADRIITMTSPLPGFPEARRFFLKAHGENSPFMWLQSLDDPELAFVTIQAGFLHSRYDPEISAATRQELQATPEQALEILLILTIPHGDPAGITANLLGPVVLNPQQRLAKQVVQDLARYDPRWPVKWC